MLKISSIRKFDNHSKEKIIKPQPKFHIKNLDQNSNQKLINNKKPISSKKNSYISPNLQNTYFSVKIPNKDKVNLDTNIYTTTSPLQQNNNNKIFSSQNLTNSYSDLRTSASFSSQKSSESYYSNNHNNNISQFNQNNNIFIIPNCINSYNFQRKNEFPINYTIDISNSLYNKNLLSKGLINIVDNNAINYKFLNSGNSNSNNSIRINNENHNHKKSKNYPNKFNSSKENNGMKDNIIILCVAIKVGKNDIRIFKLKKFDDLFVSLEKFIKYNKIKEELVKPLITAILKALNKIFYALNNKIGRYDLEYLNSLYKLWIKNNGNMPKTKNKNHIDKSTKSSFDSSSENSYKEIKSNSYQNSDGNNSDEKRSQHTANSF